MNEQPTKTARYEAGYQNRKARRAKKAARQREAWKRFRAEQR